MRVRPLVAAVFGAAVVAACILPSRAAPTAQGTTSASATTYVVAYADGADSAAARAAIRGAGGQLLDENTQIGMATVVTTRATFAAEVRRSAAIFGAARDRSIGTARPGMGHKFRNERLDAERQARKGEAPPVIAPATTGDPLSSAQWDMAMIHATAEGSYAVQPGRREVLVGVMDTGIDGSHPDIAPNFDAALSRNFTVDDPLIDGACVEDPDGLCTDPADVDEDGHGTHVAGTIAAPLDGFGMAGVAPGVTLVNLRAGQDSGYFFIEPFVDALTYAADAGIDVINMSFYIDPWLYNCASADQYLKSPKSVDVPDDVQEQATIRHLVFETVGEAHDAGITLVAAAGNDTTDLAAGTRIDASSPDYLVDDAGLLVDGAYSRRVTNQCLDLPSEAPDVLSVSSIGPSTQKADYSNWGYGQIDVAAPGGWYRDFKGTTAFRTPGNMILGPYPTVVAKSNGELDTNGEPNTPFVIKQCPSTGATCAYYQWIQGTSMASPHAAGVAALIVSAIGWGNGKDFGADPDLVANLLRGSATDTACDKYNYAQVGRHPADDYIFKCEGTPAYNNVYGDGIIDALAAVGG